MAGLKKYAVATNGAVYHLLLSDAEAKKRGLTPVEEPKRTEKPRVESKQARPANKAAAPADK